MATRSAGVLLLAAAAWLGVAGPAARADDAPPIPAGLPHYQLDLTVAPRTEIAQFRLRVTWTNRHTRPTDQLVFNFYPHYRVPASEYLLLAKTLELLRLSPSAGIERVGGHGRLDRLALAGTDTPLGYRYSEEQPTILTVQMPHAVGAGESVSIDLDGSIRLPEKQGRWGQWKGVAFLTHSLPTLSYYDDEGWRQTPFVAWHQPFWNEAGVYDARVTLPADQVLACSATVKSVEDAEPGWRKHTLHPFVGRDFAVICCADYREYTQSVRLPSGKSVLLKCVAYERHEFYAREILRIVAEAMPVYSQWFGDYPYEQFTIAESYFGWNGNECSGMILIDERVFQMPQLGRGYVEYLVSHETCHQWWYNKIGTNGYSETWIDEGAATHFTHRMLDRKRGRNNELLEWPSDLAWLPNIKRENYRYGAMYGFIRKGEMPAAAGDLKEFGHLYGLFTGAYDRGSKVYGMIEERLGEAAFNEWIRGLSGRYHFAFLSGKALQADLEAFSGQPWDDFFRRWVYGKGMTDWSLEDVSFGSRPGPVAAPSGGTEVRVVVRQNGEYDEPTTIGFQFEEGDKFPLRIPVGVAGRVALAEYRAEVEPLGQRMFLVRATLPRPPTQVVVDPDGVLLDSNPGNNAWKTPPAVKVTPLYTMLDDTDLTKDWDRWNFTAGPWIGGALYEDPWYTRSTMLGVRAGAYRTQTFYGGVYAAARSDYRDLVVGADGVWDHWPAKKSQVGFNVEQRVGGPYFGTDGEDSALRAALYGRYVLAYGSSLYLPPMNYVDLYAAYSSNFLPFARTFAPGAVRPGWTQLNGLHYRLNLLTPYWDPENGFWIDATVAGGVARLSGKEKGMVHSRLELAAARKLPEGHGYWSEVRLAGRVVAQGATPDEGQFYALGGGTLYRGFDLAERQGSVLWVVNQEVRLPLLRDKEWDVLDHTAGLRNLYLALFSDIGAVYADGRSVGGTAYALGAGLRADVAIFSFIERVTMRLDVGKTVNAATPMQVWFGVQHPF